jgi:hypothetical protein
VDNLNGDGHNDSAYSERRPTSIVTRRTGSLISTGELGRPWRPHALARGAYTSAGGGSRLGSAICLLFDDFDPLWGRMGTSLAEPRKPDGTQYLSGTEYEFESARAAGRDVLLYQRTAKVLIDLEDEHFEEKRRQKQQVDRFVREIRAQGRGVNTFEKTEDFGRAIAAHVNELVKQFLEKGENARPPAVDAIIRARPELQFVLSWPRGDFDRVWIMALGGRLTHSHVYFTKPHCNSGLVVSASFSTELGGVSVTCLNQFVFVLAAFIRLSAIWSP